MRPAREWTCAQCRAIEIQTGPRAVEMLPSPPLGWIAVDVTQMLPARTTGEGAQRQKIGESRETFRLEFCPLCKAKYLPVENAEDISNG